MMLCVRAASLLLTVAATLLTLIPAPWVAAHPSADGRVTAAGTPPAVDTARIEVRLLGRVNRVRRKAGCRPLRAVDGLHATALAHSVAMASQRTLSHQVPGEAGLRERIAAAGYADASRVGEVVAMGPMSARGALRRWLASPPHRAVLLECGFRLAGLGVHAVGRQLWWTIDLVRR
jgi:uncharacterized protein YkwD